MIAVTSFAPDRSVLAELRNRIAALEERLPHERPYVPDPASAPLVRGPARLRTGVDRFDRLFSAPGLPCGTLHELESAQSRHGGALTGFAAALLACLSGQGAGHVLWVSEAEARREAGGPNAEGLARFGLDPARVVLVHAHRVEEGLWAAEEGLRVRALTAVVIEVRGAPQAFDLTASRRLQLRAEGSGVTAFVLRHGALPAPSAAMTRCRVMPRLSAQARGSRLIPLGRASWRVHLERNRDGRPAVMDLEWDHATQGFIASADRQPLVSGTRDRPAGTTGTGRVVAFGGS